VKKTGKDPSAYLALLPDDVRDPMQRLDRLIGYGDLTTERTRGKVVEWFMVGLALQKSYLSLYVNAIAGGQYVAEQYREKLGRVKVGKASISFKRLEDVDLDVLREVVTIARGQL